MKNAEERKRRVQGERRTLVVLGSSVLLPEMAEVVEEGPEEDEGARAGARAADEDLVAAEEVGRVVEVALGETAQPIRALKARNATKPLRSVY